MTAELEQPNTVTAPSLRVIVGDSREALKALLAESVELVVTSPPYDQLRTYQNSPKWDFEGTAHELYRILVEGGVCCWNVGDSVEDGSESLTSFKQAIYFKEQVGFRLHDTMIYHKTNFSNPETVRYYQVFEYVFVLSKGKPKTFNPIRDRKNIYAGLGTLGQKTQRERDGSMKLRNSYTMGEYGMRSNIWRGNTRGQEDPCQSQPHPAMMPKWLARDLILSWSNPGDTVLDPFSGSGTTAQMALENGRNAIAIDVNPDYADIIRQSTNTTPGLCL